MHKVKRGSTPVVAEKLQRRSSSREARAEKGVLVEVVLLALRRERQLPRALLTSTHLRRTFHWPLSARFRRVVFLARRAVDRAPNHTAEKWAEWATAIWGAISAYWRASHARRSSFRVKGKNQSFRRRAEAQKIEPGKTTPRESAGHGYFYLLLMYIVRCVFIRIY